MKKINVLSLFNGMSCGQIALKQLGMIPKRYYASEIDKFAIRQTPLNFPGTIQLGDVEQWREWEIDWRNIDLLLAGSPCQGFSTCGKHLAFDDPRSRLFFVFADILSHLKSLNPELLFLFENVRMKKEYRQVITDYCRVKPVNINSNLVSAQSRDRWYWTNISENIPLPEDKGILLRDILEDNPDEKYYVSQAAVDRMVRNNHLKPAMDPDKKGACDPGTAFIPLDGKAPAQRACHGGSLAKKHNYRFICAAMRRREAKQDVYGKATRKGIEKKETQQQGKYVQRLEPRKDGKTNCLMTTRKDNWIIRLGGGYDKREAYENKTPALSSCSREQNNVLPERAERIRRLTPLECARLQTIPSWYKWEGTSDTQIYKMLGNGWTVDIIVHILGFMNMNRVPAKKWLKRHLDKKCRKRNPLTYN